MFIGEYNEPFCLYAQCVTVSPRSPFSEISDTQRNSEGMDLYFARQRHLTSILARGADLPRIFIHVDAITSPERYVTPILQAVSTRRWIVSLYRRHTS